VGGDKGEGEEFLSKIQRALGPLQGPAPDGVGVNHGRPDVAGDVRLGTFFIFSYFYCEVGLTMIVVLHAKTITIRYAGGTASYYCQGQRKTTNL
jgi:hypothetical protein